MIEETLDFTLFAINLTVFAASLLQAASGIGFGLMAGPVLLLVLGANSAIQVSALLSLTIAAILMPSLYQHINRRMLRRFIIGSCLGIPAGAVAYALFSLVALKLLAGVVVLMMCAQIVLNWPSQNKRPLSDSRPALLIGAVSGLMSATLAMPGPAPAAWMTLTNENRDAVRATILSLFLFSYPVAIAFQATLTTMTAEPFRQTLYLLPATVAGVYLGRRLATHVNQRTFRRIISVILLGTGLALLADVGAYWI